MGRDKPKQLQNAMRWTMVVEWELTLSWGLIERVVGWWDFLVLQGPRAEELAEFGGNSSSKIEMRGYLEFGIGGGDEVGRFFGNLASRGWACDLGLYLHQRMPLYDTLLDVCTMIGI